MVVLMVKFVASALIISKEVDEISSNFKKSIF